MYGYFSDGSLDFLCGSMDGWRCELRWQDDDTTITSLLLLERFMDKGHGLFVLALLGFKGLVSVIF